MTKYILLDTDIGTDVDDCLALAFLLASPELELAGVTTVYGDVALRARMVRKLLSLRGGPPVPVAAGASRPLLGRRPVYWAGHEGQGLLGPEDEPGNREQGEHAVDLIRRTVLARPGAVILVAIGPLTNVALALLVEPRLAASLAGLVVMGGVVAGGYRKETPGGLQPGATAWLPWAEHNFRSDPEAAHVVLANRPPGEEPGRAPLTIVPLDVTRQVCIRESDLPRLRAAGDRFHLAIADQVARYPRFAARGWTNLHDPLALATVIEPSLVQVERLHAAVETQGEQTAGMLLVAAPTPEAPANVSVALSVDGPRAEAFILDRLAK